MMMKCIWIIVVLALLVLIGCDDHDVHVHKAYAKANAYESSSKGDKVNSLPGQPNVSISQYAGYVTVNESHGRALFYWFIQSPSSSSSKPLLLWLNGGPGCSSIGYGAAEEIGPFIMNKDGSTLSLNRFSWIKEANLLFLESPAGVGFSYSNTSSDYSSFGDTQTALDAYAFLVGWFKKFPQYKRRDFYIAGESYAGHYIPQLANLIIDKNEGGHGPHIRLKGILIGNGLIDDALDTKGIIDYAWSHGVISGSFYKNISKACDFTSTDWSNTCISLYFSLFRKYESINIYDLIANVCNDDSSSNSYTLQHRPFPLRISNTKFAMNMPNGRAGASDPCIDNYVFKYLNRADVQRALHANTTSIPYKWNPCSVVLKGWVDSPSTVLPVLRKLMSKGLRVWLFSGDMDGRIPFLSTQYSIGSLQLPTLIDWYPWYHNDQVAGWSEVYTNLTFATVRDAGHMVATFQPQRALALFKAFIKGKPLPTS